MSRCQNGSRKCSINRFCFKKSTSSSKTKRCQKGSRKCANNNCYRKTRKNAISRKRHMRNKTQKRA